MNIYITMAARVCATWCKHERTFGRTQMFMWINPSRGRGFTRVLSYSPKLSRVFGSSSVNTKRPFSILFDSLTYFLHDITKPDLITLMSRTGYCNPNMWDVARSSKSRGGVYRGGFRVRQTRQATYTKLRD